MRLFRTGRDRSRPVRAQLPVSTREQLERSFRILETTSRHGTSGRDRSRPVKSVVWTLEWVLPTCRKSAAVGTRLLDLLLPLLGTCALSHVFKDCVKADTRTLISFGETRVSLQDGLDNCWRSQKYYKAANRIHIQIKSINNGTFGTKL